MISIFIRSQVANFPGKYKVRKEKEKKRKKEKRKKGKVEAADIYIEKKQSPLSEEWRRIE